MESPLALVVLDGSLDGVLCEHCGCNGVSICSADEMGGYALEQWSFTGGRQSSLAISVFLIDPACSSVIPFTRVVLYRFPVSSGRG